VIFQKLRSLIAQWRATEIDEEMGQLLPVMSSPLLMSRRRFLQTVVPAALVMPVLAEELLHPGRATFLPSAPTLILNQSGQLWDLDVEAIVKRELSRDMAHAIDSNVWKVNELGGYFYSRELAKKLRTAFQPMASFRQFADLPSLGAPMAIDVYKDATA
jgi:hypothetical protein